jgi:hypothetical protein
VDRNVTAPTGVIGPRGGGGSNTSGGSSYAGTYRLTAVNDSSLPHQLFYDSASGTGSSGDTTRVFQAIMDSSVLSLNTDSTAVEYDYVTIRDDRTADTSFQTGPIEIGDTTAGTWSVSGSTVIVTRTDTVGGTHSVVTDFTSTSGALTGVELYVLYYTTGGIATSGQATFTYSYSGAPLAVRVRESKSVIGASPRASVIGAAAASSPWRWRLPVPPR